MSFFRKHKSSPQPPSPTVPVEQVEQMKLSAKQDLKVPPPVNTSTKPTVSSSQFIQFQNVTPHETLRQRMVLLHGTTKEAINSSIVVYHHLNSFPAQRFPVVDGYFKALVYLEPGPNNLTFVCDSNGKQQSLDLRYEPLLQDPPLHLAIIVGKDSDGTFDSPDYKKKKEGNSLDLLVKKVRMSGYMMSAFTQEQMKRNGFGARTFRLAESWSPDSLTNRDNNQCRQTAIVHIVRSDKTRAEIRDPERAQQNPKGKDTGALFGFALDALRSYGGPFTSGQPVHVACIFADTHWDTSRKLVLGHAALGGGAGDIRLAIFGSHACHAWPSCVEEIVPCFLDDTRTDTNQVANDANQSGTSWEACNIGMGAFMHEIGHLLGCPHQPYGVMLRDYITWNRSFMCTEAFCARTNSPGKRICLANDECGWHRLDILRFRHHPSFRLPCESPVRDAEKPNVYCVNGGGFVRSKSGIYLVELHVEGQCRAHIEFGDYPVSEVFLMDDDLQQRLPPEYRRKDVKLEILGCGEQQVTVEDFGTIVRPKRREDGFLSSNKLGGGSGDEQTTVIPPSSTITSIRIYSGRALDGIEFFLDGSKKPILFGEKGGSPHDFPLEKGEQFLGLCIRSGAWIDAAQVITDRRRSQMFGNAQGGSAHDLVPPTGYRFAGLYGNVGSWVVSTGLLYCQ